MPSHASLLLLAVVAPSLTLARQQVNITPETEPYFKSCIPYSFCFLLLSVIQTSTSYDLFSESGDNQRKNRVACVYSTGPEMERRIFDYTVVLPSTEELGFQYPFSIYFADNENIVGELREWEGLDKTHCMYEILKQ